jgi:Tfp pilus assembly protein PilF
MPCGTSTFSINQLRLLLCVCLLTIGIRTATRAQQPQLPASPASAERAHGIELYQRGDNEGAVKLLRAATKAHKDDAEAWHYLALAFVRKEKYKDAQKASEQELKLRPSSAAALNTSAYLHFLQGRPDLAREAAGRAAKLEPQSADAHYLLALTNYYYGVLPGAQVEVEAALKYAPDYPPAVLLQGQVLLALSRRAFISANGETADVRELLNAKADERLAAAARSIEKYLRLVPHDSNAVLLQDQFKALSIYIEQATKPPGERTVLSSSEVTTRAVILRKPTPEFTEQARQHHVTGEVLLRMVLGADGTVQYILPVKTLPDGLTEKSIAVARQLKFIPATKDGRPVSQYVIVSYNFNIY